MKTRPTEFPVARAGRHKTPTAQKRMAKKTKKRSTRSRQRPLATSTNAPAARTPRSNNVPTMSNTGGTDASPEDVFAWMTGDDNTDLPVDLQVVPEEGWAAELVAARKAARRKETPATLLRLCRAYRMMRQWEKLRDNAVKAAACMENNDDGSIPPQVQELLVYEVRAEVELQRTSLLKCETARAVFRESASFERDYKKFPLGTSMFSNLTWLHGAVSEGDIRLMELLVARGAALEHPPLRVRQSTTQHETKESLPPGCTALLLGCAIIATNSLHSTPGSISQEFHDKFMGLMNCVSQLVRLGADCSATLHIPASSCPGPTAVAWRKLGFHGKTARELVVVANFEPLVALMDQHTGIRSNVQDLCRLTHCRCGSRLPWKHCHLGPLPTESLVFRYEGRLLFRHSPTDICRNCKTNKKPHYDCCWDSPTPCYLDDKTGFPLKQGATDLITSGGRWSHRVQMQMAVQPPPGSIFSADPGAQRKIVMAHSMRHCDFHVLQSGPYGESYRSMDVDVYVGTFERIDNAFFWATDHWGLSKLDLLERVEEWNAALGRYCDDMELDSAERESVIELHRASPLTRCGNPKCKEMEKSVKQFNACSRCRTVAYCSAACQKVHWKETHKTTCRKF